MLKRTLSKLVALSVVFGGLAMGQAVHADTFTLGNYNHPFYVSAVNLEVRPSEFVSFNNKLDMGGDGLGVLNGELLAGTYCVGLVDTIYLNHAYNATVVNATGSVFGETINNADKISWLVSNFAATATTDDLQNALQAAIWKTEYGAGFQLDGVENANAGNSIGLQTAYQNYLTALGNNTTDVSNVIWISAYTAPGQQNGPPAPPTAHYQGLVGVRSGNLLGVPEPGTVALMLGAVLPIIGVVVKRRRN